MNPVIRGYTGPLIQKQTGRWSPTSGWTFDQDFAGLDANQLLALATEYANAGVEYEITAQPGVCTLRTIDTRGTVTIDTWEVGVNHNLASVFKNPFNTVMFNLDVHDMTKFLEGVQNKTNWDDVYEVMFDTENEALLKREYIRFCSGQDSFFSDQFTLRHTTNASNRGYYNVADSNVNCIYTQAQLYNEITNGGYWFFPAPNEIIGALNVIFNSLPLAPAFYLNGALKGASPRNTAANNRVNIVTEYKIFGWSTDEYGYAT